MIVTLSRRIRWGYIIAFLLLLISYFLIFFAIQRLLKESNSVTHTFNVINQLESLHSEVAEAETGVRGYIITKDIRFLDPYTTAHRRIPVILDRITNLTQGNEYHIQNLSKLKELITDKLYYLSFGLTQFQKEGFVITDVMKANREASKSAMDSIRIYINSMSAHEESVMAQRKGKLSGFFVASRVITIISLVIAMLAIFFSWLTYNWENKAKTKADEKTLQYRQELEENIKELRHANAELQELKSIEKFAATGRIARTIAHEVRNPLTNITLAADQLKEIPQGNEDISSLLQMVSRNATRINNLVSDLLNATRFAQLEFRTTNMNKLLDETLDMATDRIDLHNIKVEKHYSQELKPVAVDPEKMKLALLNIIVNAIEAMEKNKGILQLKTRQQSDSCVIEIRDNGAGMDEEVLQKIFEPYYTAKADGNGLGLTNTQNIILNHKGKIKAYSRPGKGTTFVVTLSISEI
jgi:signal transduction histidine kinase